MLYHQVLLIWTEQLFLQQWSVLDKEKKKKENKKKKKTHRTIRDGNRKMQQLGHYRIIARSNKQDNASFFALFIRFGR